MVLCVRLSMQSNLTTANDNMPLGHNVPIGCSDQMRLDNPASISTLASSSSNTIYVSQFSPIKPSVRIHLPKVPAPVSQQTSRQQAVKIKRHKTSRFPVFILLTLWLLGVIAIARFAGSPNDATLIGIPFAIAIGVQGILSLVLASIAKQRQAKISHSIGIAGASVCMVSLFWYYQQQTSINIPAEFLTLGISASSLICARLWKSPFLLHISLLVMAGWNAYCFMAYQVSELAWLFPALWSMQIFLALEFRIKRSIILAIFAGLIWIIANWFLLK